MMGIKIESPANIYYDNQSLVVRAQRPESTLKKKHNAINFHRIREAITMGIGHVTKEATETNLEDLLTKYMGTFRRRKLLG